MADIDFKPIDFNPIEEPKEEGLNTGDVLRPLSQGFSLGTADEIMGAAKAAKRALGGEVPLTFEALKDAYIHHRNEERLANKHAEEKNPMLYKGLELAGGLAAPIPGVGELKGLSTAAKIGKLALHGASAGGVAGLGYSEGQTPQEIASDVALGGTVGALPGAALGSAGVLAKAGSHVPNLGLLPTSNIGKGMLEGISGKVPGNTNLTADIEGLLQKLGNKRKATKQAYESLIQKAEGQGVTIPGDKLDEMVHQLQKEYATNRSPSVKKDIAKVVENIKAYTQEQPNLSRNLNPREAQNLKSNLSDQASFKTNQLESSEGREFAKDLKNNLSEQLNEVMPGLVGNDKDYSALKATLENIGVDPKKLYTKDPLSGELQINPKALSVVQNMFKNAAKDKASGLIAQKQVGLLQNGLEALGEKANTGNILKSARSSNVFDTTGGKFGAYTGYGAQKTASFEPTTRALATAPESLDLYPKQPKNSYELSKDSKGASKTDMIDFASTAESIPGLEEQGKTLKQATDMGDLKTMNQVMFDLLQRPSFRKSLERKPTKIDKLNATSKDIEEEHKP